MHNECDSLTSRHKITITVRHTIKINQSIMNISVVKKDSHFIIVDLIVETYKVYQKKKVPEFQI